MHDFMLVEGDRVVARSNGRVGPTEIAAHVRVLSHGVHSEKRSVVCLQAKSIYLSFDIDMGSL